MPEAGQLQDRLRFEQRAEDLNGDRLGAWTAACTCWAELKPLKGGETVMAARLQGEQPFLITVRASAATRAIDNSFRAVDTRDAARVFDVTSATLSADRAFVEILATVRKEAGNG